MGRREDPTEGYLHTVLLSEEVLPFSDALAAEYEYPYILGKEQPNLHTGLVYSSIYGIPLITPTESKGLRTQTHWEQAKQPLRPWS